MLTNRGLQTWLLVGTIAGGLLAAGCPAGKPVQPEYPVKGTVTLDGSPLPEGDVYFRDEATATMSVLKVKDGKFEGKSEAGKFKVEINSFREDTAKTDTKTGYAPPGGTTTTNVIPAEYNVVSKLTAEVTESGPNEYAFEIKSK